MLKEGMFIQERYEIIAKIGSGGMADVYKAKDHKLNRFVAVKVLKSEFREDKAFISKFRVEAQSAAGLAHPNIVNVYDVGDDNGIYFIVMELVEGITLKEYIEKKGKLAVREATSIAIQVSMGLEAAHNNNIVHRDVKPQNIIISTDGKVKVTDFGIARAASSNTISSNVMGSVHYSSPEQSRGGYSDFKSDIYSLGITMYEMVTGYVPFDGDSTVAIAIKHLQEEMQSPRKFVPDLPKSTVQIIYKCTQKSPDRRYGVMEELIRDLKESLVNPEGDFVQILPLTNHAQTVVISKDELDQINNGYEEGAGDGGYGNGTQEPLRGSYGNNAGGNYGSYGNNRYPEDGYPEEEEEDEDSVNPKLEKFMTVGSIVIGVIILGIFLALVGNAVGLFDFNFLHGKNEKQTTESMTETETNSTEAGEVAVPNLAGKTRAEVSEELNKLGLGANYGGEKESSEYAAGLVVSQSPEAGSSVAKNTTVTFYLSKGQGDITVPDVSGMSYSSAQAALQAEELRVSADYAYDNNVAEGLVIYSSPAAGSSVEKGSSVKIYISKGPEQTEPNTEANTKKMPYVVGDTAESAKAALEALGLNVNITEDVSTTYSAGKVISQSISQGTAVTEGTTVSLVVSVGAGDPEVPGSNGSQTESNGDANNQTHNYACNVNLDAPAGYNGEPVKIVVEQDGIQTTVVNGAAVAFPYNLNVKGNSDSVGTAYLYVTQEDGSVATYTYNNVGFKQVN